MELKIAFAEKPKDRAEKPEDRFVFDMILDGESHLREIPFTSPLAENDLKELRWYLEEYLDWPFSEPVQKRGVGSTVASQNNNPTNSVAKAKTPMSNTVCI